MEFIGTELHRGEKRLRPRGSYCLTGPWGELSPDKCRMQAGPDFLDGTVPLAVLRIGLRGGPEGRG